MRFQAVFLTLFSLAIAVLAQRAEKDDFLVNMNKEILRNGGAQKHVNELAFDTVFPGSKDSQFVSGEPAEVVVGVTNLAPHPTAVFAISGYFAEAKNTSKPIHELDAQRFNIRLDSKQQASFPLRFTPEMEAQDLILVVLIDFFDADETPRRAIAFQGPVKIIPSDFILDFAGISVIVVISGLAYIGYKIATNPPKTSSSSNSSSSSSSAEVKKQKIPAAEIREKIAAKKEQLDDEWIPEHLKKADKKKK
ncbi:hypothetical protein BCR33DRAFT_854355 [Rhizoclosmatium globosum]|uniref:Translocon-associated protein subunit alpha n=1 Tax=Rhizoclosmatium globosum TaxID=329046 RepID=A0A1Y2BTB7_9FUNG|nr:hypothetical protein HDU99_004718 [Rhizoclosmatium hyalinum]ORY37887.1 hypothetical protein BCR33DRAFT_854355 [Rhizoclosmatium globosum]|eukprot:ORY37887.1 hypothetical protein BCR33DRAFT_854355 [Rhizoclosmatium globosum]